eukprot:COSAG02_NODE_66666_length_255_cov_0.423077_1_plen_33_part_01
MPARNFQAEPGIWFGLTQENFPLVAKPVADMIQ